LFVLKTVPQSAKSKDIFFQLAFLKIYQLFIFFIFIIIMQLNHRFDMNPLNYFSSICLDDKENVRSQALETRARVAWSCQPDRIMLIEKKEELVSEELWHDLMHSV
jgi:hypothetical protein